MFLSIITINRNNVVGLERTLQSVFTQTVIDFEFVVVDGASTDGSVGVIKHYSELFGSRMKWISEPDRGIYNAMNKGIRMSSGDYLVFLNSGDSLASETVVSKMCRTLEEYHYPSILYGNMLKEMPGKKVLRDKSFAGQEISLLGLYTGSLNHSSAFIKRVLFDVYGFYDESLKIVSDWKWFLEAIVFGHEKPIYVDIDVTLFDMHGISVTNKELDEAERKDVLTAKVPSTILVDYDRWFQSINQMKRLKRHPWAYRIVWFLERCLFKQEKFERKLKGETWVS